MIGSDLKRRKRRLSQGDDFNLPKQSLAPAAHKSLAQLAQSIPTPTGMSVLDQARERHKARMGAVPSQDMEPNHSNGGNTLPMPHHTPEKTFLNPKPYKHPNAGDDFFDSLGKALSLRRYGAANMNVLERLISSREAIQAARQSHYDAANRSQQQVQLAQEADQLGLSGMARASYMHNKGDFFDNYNERFGEIDAGNSIGQIDGSFRMAPKFYQSGNQFGVQTQNGVTNYQDFGPSLTQQAANDLTQYSHDTARMNAVTNRQNANTAQYEAVQPQQPKLHELYDPQTGQPYKARYNPQTDTFERIGGTKAPGGMGLAVAPDGTVTYGTGVYGGKSFTHKAGRNTADILKGAEDQAGNVERAQSLLQEADMIQNSPDFTPGPAAGVKALYGQADAITGGALPNFGMEDPRAFADKFKRLEAISKDLGIEKLQEVGGNDTERELLTAIQTTVSPYNLTETNQAIIRQKQAIFDIIGNRPQFMADWISKTGGIHNRDPQTGQSYREAWRDFQLRAFEPVKQAYDQQTAQGLQSGNNIPQKAIQHLHANPGLAAEFDRKYGAGSAQRVLNRE